MADASPLATDMMAKLVHDIVRLISTIDDQAEMERIAFALIPHQHPTKQIMSGLIRDLNFERASSLRTALDDVDLLSVRRQIALLRDPMNQRRPSPISDAL